MKRFTRPTSIDAYLSILPKISGYHARIIEVYRRDPSRNWTNRELSKETGILPCIISTRVFELRKKGYLYRCETRRCGVSGKKVMAFALVNRAIPGRKTAMVHEDDRDRYSM